jgi:hypothetical protein
MWFLLKNELVRSFGTVRFIHEGREFINEAHNLAKASTSLDPGRHVWLINPPNIVPIPVTISKEFIHKVGTLI